MKKTVVILLILFGLQFSLQAQDVIVRKDGSQIQAVVIEIDSRQVKYKRFDNQDGPMYSESKNRVRKIKYANGSEDIFAKENIVWIQDEEGAYRQIPAPTARKEKKVRYSGSVEISPFLGFDYMNKDSYYRGNGLYVAKPDGYAGVSFTTTHGIQLLDKYFFGAGIGLNVISISENAVHIPVYTTFRMDLSRAQARPFVDFSLGMQVGWFDSDETYVYDGHYVSNATIGLWSKMMFGYKFKNKLYLAAGLTIQNAIYFDEYYDEWYDEEIFGMIGLMVGFGVKF